jgi:membrane carboxypeptidase/penicillin-binding protein
MAAALAKQPAADFPQPEGVVAVTIDPTTGQLATEDCPTRREEFFLDGTQPLEYCSRHRGSAEPAAPPPAADGGGGEPAAATPQR